MVFDPKFSTAFSCINKVHTIWDNNFWSSFFLGLTDPNIWHWSFYISTIHSRCSIILVIVKLLAGRCVSILQGAGQFELPLWMTTLHLLSIMLSQEGRLQQTQGQVKVNCSITNMLNMPATPGQSQGHISQNVTKHRQFVEIHQYESSKRLCSSLRSQLTGRNTHVFQQMIDECTN